MKREKSIKRYFVLAVIVLLFIGGITGTIIYFLKTRSIYVKENILEQKNISDVEIKQANPIILNNILMGAWSDKNWINAEKYVKQVETLKEKEASFYDENGKIATNALGEVKLDNGCYWVYSERKNISSGFIATTTVNNMLPREYTKVDLNGDMKTYTDSVKKILNNNGIMNNTVKLRSIYEVMLENRQDKGYIIIASNDISENNGVYSLILYVKGNNTEVVKLSYSNKENTKNWPFYDLLYLADINGDGTEEIAIQEIKEMNIKQSIIEYRKEKFYEVLSTEYSMNF